MASATRQYELVMAESPQTWDCITGSLAISDLENPYNVWAFLVLQGIVLDAPENRQIFVDVVAQEKMTDITGPTAARRISLCLRELGIVLPAGLMADPWGKKSAE